MISLKSFITIFLLISSLVFVPSYGPRIDLEQAFNQNKIYEKHSELLKRLGCAKNLQQVGAMSKDEKDDIEFPWNDYQRLLYWEQWKDRVKDNQGITYLVNDYGIFRIPDEYDIDVCDVKYGEFYPFPWGHYDLLKKEYEEKVIKKIRDLYHEDSLSYSRYSDFFKDHVGTLTSKEWNDIKVGANDPNQFRNECLGQLEWEHTKAHLEPIKKSLSKSIMTLFVAGITTIFGDSKSEATKTIEQTGIASALYETTKGVVEHVPSLIWPPENPLQDLEERFAQNKCFIPSELWPKIIKSFTYAREDTMNRQKHINFLNFALDLTVYKSKPELLALENRSIKNIKKELDTRIDEFFKDYPKDKQVTSTIKLNVAKFIDSLTSLNAPAPSYLYLHGPGGIGKTHFVQTLAKWIDELIPQAITFENLVINSSEDLEGNHERPGAFIKVLRNQLAQGKRGSIVFIDEACWLNNVSMCSAIKRTFNGNRSQLSVACFGSGIDGAIKIDAKVPMLIILAGNAPSIDDKALGTRIKNFFFSSPDKSVLTKKALQIALESNYLQENNCKVNEAIISQWIDDLPSEHCNFRYVENNVEDYILELMEKNEKQ